MLKRTLLGLCLLVAVSSGIRADDEVKIAAAKKVSVNNLKQLAIGMHNYESTTGQFPNNIAGKDGKPLLSWRVLILPYIEEEQLYKAFKLDEAWDSEHNKKLIEKMPKMYEAVIGKAEKGHTYYQGFTGKHTIFEENKRITLASITDGTSNTFLVVEGAKTIEWTKPDDLLLFDITKDELPKVGGTLFKDGFNASMADGSVRFIKSGLEKTTLKALITRDRGEVIK